MSTNNNRPLKSFRDMKCIWMDSGLVNYKLCDKDFNCDACEFDRVFRNIAAKTEAKNIPQHNNADIVDKLVKRIENVNYDNKLIYLRNQLVMKNLFGNAYYIGINPMLLYLLDDYRDVHEFHSNEIKKNQIVLTFEGGWGFKQFVSPINFLIIEKVNSLDFKTNQWYAIILFNPSDNEDYIMDHGEWEHEKHKMIEKINGYSMNQPSIGVTMADGGSEVGFFHQYIGRREYNKLLNMFFI